jgi:hypothetical protein
MQRFKTGVSEVKIWDVTREATEYVMLLVNECECCKTYLLSLSVNSWKIQCSYRNSDSSSFCTCARRTCIGDMAVGVYKATAKLGKP